MRRICWWLHRRQRPEGTAARWRAAAEAEAIPRTGWDHPANEALVEALFEHRDPKAALERVIEGRYDAGFTFSECATDLQALLRLLPRTIARRLKPLDIAVSIGAVFVDGEAEQFAFSMTGLPDRTYLAARVRETYRPIQRTLPWVLVVVRTDSTVTGWAAVSRQLQVATVLEEAFWSAHSLAVVGPDCHVALMPEGADISTACMKVIDELSAAGVVTRCWIEPLPPDPAQVPAVLEAVCGRRCAPARDRLGTGEAR